MAKTSSASARTVLPWRSDARLRRRSSSTGIYLLRLSDRGLLSAEFSPAGLCQTVFILPSRRNLRGMKNSPSGDGHSPPGPSLVVASLSMGSTDPVYINNWLLPASAYDQIFQRDHRAASGDLAWMPLPDAHRQQRRTAEPRRLTATNGDMVGRDNDQI